MAYRLNLTSTVPDAVRDLVRAELANAAHQLRDEFDDDPVTAVHEVRKSLKKARAVLRLIRPGLPKRVFRTESRALRDAGRLVSGARDADVLLETLDALAVRFAENPAADGLDPLREHLLGCAQASRASASGTRAAIVAILDAVAGRVEDWPLERCNWRTVAEGIEQAYRAGRRAFAAAQENPDTERLHDWRKRVKDLWYQLRLVAAAGGLEDQGDAARALAKVLGEDHDLATLAELLAGAQRPDPSVLGDTGPLLALIAERRAELAVAASGHGAILHGEPPRSFARRTRQCLHGARDAAVAAARVGAGLEIERRFLVPALPPDLDAHPSDAIEQGYIATDGPVEVRLRRRAGRALLTIKSGGGLIRVEQELELDADGFDVLWPLSEGRRVTKTRHRIPGPGALTIELDVFSGTLDGLVIAEVEFASPAASRDFAPPSWFGAEVTEDGRFANRALATDGLPPGR